MTDLDLNRRLTEAASTIPVGPPAALAAVERRARQLRNRRRARGIAVAASALLTAGLIVGLGWGPRPGDRAAPSPAEPSLTQKTLPSEASPIPTGVLPDGRTYGTEAGPGKPDLIAVGIDANGDGQMRGFEGFGFADRVDLNGVTPESPKQALRMQENVHGYRIPVYMQDGLTIISLFSVGEPPPVGVNGTPPPDANDASPTGTIVVRDGCMHLVTSDGPRWLILPLGYHLGPDGATIDDPDGRPFQPIGSPVDLDGFEHPGQASSSSCETGTAPLYVAPRPTG